MDCYSQESFIHRISNLSRFCLILTSKLPSHPDADLEVFCVRKPLDKKNRVIDHLRPTTCTSSGRKVEGGLPCCFTSTTWPPASGLPLSQYSAITRTCFKLAAVQNNQIPGGRSTLNSLYLQIWFSSIAQNVSV